MSELEENLDRTFLTPAEKGKRFLLLFGGVLFVVCVGGYLIVGWMLMNPVWTPAPKPPKGIVISPTVLREHVTALVKGPDSRDFAHPKRLEEAAQYVKGIWHKQGFTPTEQPYKVSGQTVKNVLIKMGPSHGPRVVVGAHYDVCGSQAGADDNASGVAGLLALSQWLKASQSKLKYGLDLVAYTLEEPPFFRTLSMGSAVHAKSLKQAGTKVKLMISLEMIGYFSDAPGSQSFPASVLGAWYPSVGHFITLIGDTSQRGRLQIRQLKAAMMAAGKVPVYSMNAPSSVPGIDFSDHLNYWALGFPAVMITDTSFYRNKNYHKKTDTIDTLDFKRMAEVVKGVAWALISMP